MSVADFLTMGQYGAYVWACYGIAMAGILGLCLTSVHKVRYYRRQLRLSEAQSSQSSKCNDDEA